MSLKKISLEKRKERKRENDESRKGTTIKAYKRRIVDKRRKTRKSSCVQRSCVRKQEMEEEIVSNRWYDLADGMLSLPFSFVSLSLHHSLSSSLISSVSYSYAFIFFHGFSFTQ